MNKKSYYNYVAIIAFFALMFGIYRMYWLRTSYALPNWYSDYTYVLDNVNKTITLQKYNGTATEIVIPATATIDSNDYQVILLGNSTRDDSLFSKNSTITKVTIENGVKAGVTLRYLFNSCTELEEVNFNNFDTSATTDMGYMFYGCSKIRSLDLSSFDTTNVTTIAGMFNGCTKLEELNIANFDTRNLTGMANYIHVTSSLKKLTIGPNTRFYATGAYVEGNTIKGSTFGRGVWKKLEDGKLYDAVDIAISNATSRAGTYVKQSNIIEKMMVDYNVTYRINNFENLLVVEKGNKFDFINNRVYLKDLTVASTDDYTVPGKIVLLAKNAATDNRDNNYDLRITIDNVHLYDINTNIGYDTFYARIAGFSTKFSLQSYFYPNDNFSNVIYSSSAIKQDVTLEILDQDGKPQAGSYVFTATDLDIASTRDKNSAYPYTAVSSGYGDYSEGITLLSGFDNSTVKLHPNTNLVRNGNRLFGIHLDESSELGEFTVKADAESFKFSWTGEGCGTDVLSQYQPISVEFAKRDVGNNNIAGAVLELYKENGETPIATWTTTNDTHKEFLQTGLYVLKEKTTPSGYSKANDVSFYVDFNDKLIIDGNTVNVISMTDNYNKYSYTVNYLDKADNKPIHTAKTVSNVNYKSVIQSVNEKIEIDDYLYDSSDKESITIDYDESKNVINLYYVKNEGRVIAKYIYAKTQEEILPSETIVGIVGKDYTTVQKEKDGYTFIGVEGNPNGKFKKEDTIVIYKYLKTVKLTVNHINKITNKIMDTETTTSYEGESYHASSKNYEGFVLVQKPEVEEGVFEDKDITLNYYYSQVSAGVLEKHVDFTTKEVLHNETHNGNEGDPYDIKSRDYSSRGYKLLTDKLPSNAKGTMSVDLVEVVYYYQKVHNVLTKVDGEGGTIEGDEEVFEGNDSTPNKIKITPSKDYAIDTITINGQEIEVTNENEMILDNFREMVENKEVVVRFKKVINNVPKTASDTTLMFIAIPILIIGLLVVIVSRMQKKNNFISS